jgi:hypothetical protein
VRKLSIVAALAAMAIAVPLGIGSSHREAPLTALDPTADDTDVYAFTPKNDPTTRRNEEDRLTVVANWIPFEDPAGGPNFYRFDDRAHYYINLDNNGDGRADVRYEFKFKTHVRNPNSFLYAAPQVTSINDPDQNVYQTYDIVREGPIGAHESRRGHRHKRHHARKHHRRHHRGRGRHGRGRASDNPREVVIARDYPVAPNNVGPKTIPDYNAVANQAIKDVHFPGDVGKVFVGQRDDPFFVDLGATFDAINLEARASTGSKDDLAGYSVHSIVLQIPEEDITRDGDEVSSPSDPDAVVGVWASTERKRLQVTTSGDDEGSGDWVQVSRLGNPLVNEVVIPLGKKDLFNHSKPADDAQFASYVLNPELAKLLNALFGLHVKETGRTDIVQALLQGIPGLNRQSGKPVDTLKVNLGTPPAAAPNPLGVLGGDVAGFPNGRRLTDDVVDIELRVVAGILLPPPDQVTAPLGDGVGQNDKPFSDKFPYLAPPTSGLDARLKCGAGLPPCP